jgi:tetratricopeptide (TPR) repeat protein
MRLRGFPALAVPLFLAASALTAGAAPPPEKARSTPATAAAPSISDDGKRAMELYEAKKYDEAAKILQAALAKSPQDPDLLFDLAIVLREKGDLDGAQDALQKELSLRPDDAEGHFVLGRIHETAKRRVPAVLAYLRFLSLAPDSPRVRDVAGTIETLMAGGVERDRHDPEKIVLSEKKGRDGVSEDPEVLMAFIAAAAQYADKDAPQPSDAEKLVKQIQTFVGFVVQTQRVEDPFAAKTYLPFLSEMTSKTLLEPFAWVVATNAGKRGSGDWVKKNEARVTQLKDWAKAYKPRA